MSRLETDVTLICVDTVDLNRGIDTLRKCSSVKFRHVNLISSLKIAPLPPDINATFVEIPASLLAPCDPLFRPHYSNFCIRELCKYFSTSHCLIVQHDGWVVNPAAWRDEWLEYDYIGCQTVWTEPGENGKGGNGGFSLRSRKLLQLASQTTRDYDYDLYAEDMVLSATAPRGIREDLERAGCRFAPASVQKLFGLEFLAYGGEFGHHRGTNVPASYSPPSENRV